MGEKADKQALKTLREERKAWVEHAENAIKTHNRFIRKIREEIKTEGKTVPEIAEATKIPTSQVLWYISTLRKYGQVSEGEKDGEYFKYQLQVSGN
jgi:Fic family protein